MSKFKPTGLQNIDISTGDSPERIEDNFDPMDHLTEIIYSKDVGSFKPQGTYADDMELGRVHTPSEGRISVAPQDGFNDIHFEYEGGTCFSLRIPVLVKNA